MQPDVEQLDEHTYLVTVRESALAVQMADLPSYGLPFARTFSDLDEWSAWKKRQMVAEAKKAIMRNTHVGEVLRTLPKYSNRKVGFAGHLDGADYRFGFRVHIRARDHSAFFKMACCSGRRG